eukprot:1610040-Prymnesium_polylepis.1
MLSTSTRLPLATAIAPPNFAVASSTTQSHISTTAPTMLIAPPAVRDQPLASVIPSRRRWPPGRRSKMDEPSSASSAAPAPLLRSVARMAPTTRGAPPSWSVAPGGM